ncbi:Nif3-like dinuclear metal center hexameric protein [Thalassobacillus hwangdonensis]|uniref:GTP cyclohydrolase 1 type 2 homolog n=1 Tax=Thalassobacillus hwangdonensis TaxID=546108 RepID=A0ABW3KYN5_9BACI
MGDTITGNDIIKAFEEWCPKHLAFDWDKVGLQIGTLNKKVDNVMVTLDVLENVVDEAIEKDVDLIISHHPIIFKPLEQINPDQPKGRAIQKLLKHDISVYAAHTNLDVVEGGVNDAMAKAVGVETTSPLLKTDKEKLIKLTVFVPADYADALKEAIHQAGAGHIGAYSHCSFSIDGQGQFKPSDASDPFIGEQGKLEKVEEKRVETILPQRLLKPVLQAMEEAHPYEEVAYDLYPLLNEGRSIGVGRIGELPEPMTLKDFSEQVKRGYDIPNLRVVGNLDKKVKKVALLGGSGEKYIHLAKRNGADVYITGDMTLHPAQEALEMGLSIIDPGHHVEKVMKQVVKSYLDARFNAENKQLTIYESNANTEPFQFLYNQR